MRPWGVNIYKTGPWSIELGTYIPRSGDKTSRKLTFEFRLLHRAGTMTHPDGGDLYCLTSVSQRTLQCQFIKSYWQSCQDGGQVSTNQSLVVEHVTSNHKVID